MKARIFMILAAIPLAAAIAHAEISFGGGLSYETGNSPISPVLAQVFAENVYRLAPWEVFGLDFVVACSPLQNNTFAKGLPAGPELFLGADASYRFPEAGPAEFALLIGGCGFQDYKNRINGIAAHTGLEVTLYFGDFLVQGRGLYRFFSSTGTSGEPIPLGTYSIAILGGYTLPQ